ncbi:hypothetical protein [Streptomyces sp. NPDC058695]|uniref:hypothetical protein n=1 Tax=Streptomyces sp. NPDC058695 TaxID=3346604 RepID=UPI00366674CE
MTEKALADLDRGERAAVETVRRLIEAGDSFLPSPSAESLTSEDAPSLRLVSEVGVRGHLKRGPAAIFETDQLGHSVRRPQGQHVTGSDPWDGLPLLRNFCGPVEWAAARSGGNPPARHE